MSINIIEAVQSKLGYLPLHKIDPNTQLTIDEQTGATLLQQAAVTSVLMGMYKKYNTENGSINWGIISTNLLQNIFDEKTSEVAMAVANYSHVGTDKAITEMEKVVVAVKEIAKQEITEPTAEKEKQFIIDQRNTILVYLPPDLKMGELLGDETIDDRTNKMEGPMSGLAHVVEKIFSSSK